MPIFCVRSCDQRLPLRCIQYRCIERRVRQQVLHQLPRLRKRQVRMIKRRVLTDRQRCVLKIHPDNRRSLVS